MTSPCYFLLILPLGMDPRLRGPVRRYQKIRELISAEMRTDKRLAAPHWPGGCVALQVRFTKRDIAIEAFAVPERILNALRKALHAPKV